MVRAGERNGDGDSVPELKGVHVRPFPHKRFKTWLWGSCEMPGRGCGADPYPWPSRHRQPQNIPSETADKNAHTNHLPAFLLQTLISTL